MSLSPKAKYKIWLNKVTDAKLKRYVYDTGEVYVTNYEKTPKSVKFWIYNFNGLTGEPIDVNFEVPKNTVKYIEEIIFNPLQHYKQKKLQRCQVESLESTDSENLDDDD